jgi:predicted  nucleic acid-binding Zn-ribbon protein
MRIPATAAEVRALVQLAKLDAQADALDAQTYGSRRKAAREQAPRALLERYEAVRELGREPAVAALERGACSGCHIRLATILEHGVRHAGGFHVCPRCRRLLYAPERLLEEDVPPRASESKGEPRRPPPAKER